jgi:hypothetical protein
MMAMRNCTPRLTYEFETRHFCTVFPRAATLAALYCSPRIPRHDPVQSRAKGQHWRRNGIRLERRAMNQSDSKHEEVAFGGHD